MSLTRTEQRMRDVLDDGRPHTKSELARCLPDDMGEETVDNTRMHVMNLRRKLRRMGFEIICIRRVKVAEPLYQLVRLLAPYEE